MKGLLAITAIIALALVQINAEGESDVVVLNEENFENSVSKGKWFVDFYAPWCGHCKKLTPIYEEAATLLKESGVSLGKVDCTVNQKLCQVYGIQGYPTIKAIVGDKTYNFDGPRTVEGLRQYISDLSFRSSATTPVFGTPAPTPLSEPGSDVVILTDSNFDKLTSTGTWFLEFYAPWCGHCKTLAPIYEKLATELKGKVNVGKVDCTTETAVARRFGIRGYPTVKFLKNNEIREYNGQRKLESLVEFADSGYQSASASTMPTWDQVHSDFDLGDTFKMIEGLVKEKVWVVLPMVFILGILFGKILFGTSFIDVERTIERVQSDDLFDDEEEVEEVTAQKKVK